MRTIEIAFTIIDERHEPPERVALHTRLLVEDEDDQVRVFGTEGWEAIRTTGRGATINAATVDWIRQWLGIPDAEEETSDDCSHFGL